MGPDHWVPSKALGVRGFRGLGGLVGGLGV